MNQRVVAVLACFAFGILLVQCGDRFTGPPKTGVVILDISYSHGANSSGKLAEAQIVDRMVATVVGTDGTVVRSLDLEARSGRWIGEIELEAGRYLVKLDAYRQGRVTWRGSESVDVMAGKSVTAPLEMVSTNHPPVANAGPDQVVSSGTKVQMSGGGSDADGDVLGYVWSSLDGAELSSTTVAAPTFAATSSGVFRFTLIASDGIVSSASDTVVITAMQANQWPVARAGADQAVEVGQSVQLDGTSSSDPDGDQLTYSWSSPGIILSNRTSSRPAFTAVVSGTYRITLTVNDGVANSLADTVVVTVTGTTNQAPVANAGSDRTWSSGTVVNLFGRGTDADGDQLSYRWRSLDGVTLSTTNLPVTTFTAGSAGTYRFTLTVNDGVANSLADTVVVTVTGTTNQAPVANAGSDQTINIGQTVQLDGRGSTDPDGDQLTYSWTATGIILSDRTSSRPTFVATAGGTFRVTLTVNDGNTASLSDEIVITVLVVNRRPIARAGPDQTMEVGQRLQLDGSGSSDPDGDQLTYSWSTQGIILSLTSSRPTFGAISAVGTYRYTLSVNDGTLTSLSDEVVITVVAATNGSPVARAGSDRVVEVGSTGNHLDGRGSNDPDGDQLTYSWSAPGLILSDSTSAWPTFVASAEGTFRATLTVNDGSTDSISDEVVITVVAAVNRRPVARAGSDQTVVVGQSVQLDGTSSSDADGDQLTYSWTSPDITLSNRTSSRPVFTASAAGTFRITLTVNDGSTDSSSDEVVITVQEPAGNPGTEYVICEDNFDSDDGDWFVGTGDFGSGEISGGRYTVTGFSGGVVMSKVCNSGSVSEVRYEVTMRVVDGQGSFGLRLNFDLDREPSTYSEFRYSNANQRAFFGDWNGTEWTNVEWDDGTIELNVSDYNVFRVDYVSDEVLCYLNNRLVVTSTSSIGRAERSGFSVDDFMTVQIDRFVITAIGDESGLTGVSRAAKSAANTGRIGISAASSKPVAPGVSHQVLER
jgi:hypothetical protein